MILQKCKTILIKYNLGLFIAATFLLYSFSGVSKVTSKLEAIKESGVKITSEELFKGVFFADGRVVELIPTLQEFQISNITDNDQIVNKYREMESNVFKEFQLKYPERLKEFEKVIKGGNQINIQEIIDEIAPKIAEISNSLSTDKTSNSLSQKDIETSKKDFLDKLEKSGIDKSDPHAVAAFAKDYMAIKKASTPDTQGNFGFCVMGVVIAAVIIAAVAVVIIAAVALWWDTETVKSHESRSLINAEIIDEMAENLVGL